METSEIIRELCKKNHLSVTDLESRLGFGNGSLTKGSSISSDRLLAVSQFFNVSMEYLMGKDTSSLVIAYSSIYLVARTFIFAFETILLS